MTEGGRMDVHAKSPSHVSAGRTIGGALAVVGVLVVVSSTGASFPGRNGRIAFSGSSASSRCCNSVVFTARADGSGARPLRGVNYPNWPSWSPDGRKLALVEGDTPRVVIINADGTDKRVVARNVRGALQPETPRWSPDGRRIVFDFFLGSFLTEQSHRSAVYVVGIDGTGLTRLTEPRLLARMPTWSPDGSLIAFAAKNGLYVMAPDGTGTRRLFAWKPGFLDSGTVVGSPDFSPDGSRIVFDAPSPRCRPSGLCFLGLRAIWMINSDGTGAHRVPGSCIDGQAVWAPDATKLLCAGGYVLNPDGTGSRKVRYSPVPYGGALLNPSWQPLPATVGPN